MTSWAIGDVHGNFRALDDLLQQVEHEAGSDDAVVFLGDYIDRGPDTRRCIDRILEFRGGSPATVITLMGNHEDWLLKTMRDYTRHSWILVMDAFPTIYCCKSVKEQKAHRCWWALLFVYELGAQHALLLHLGSMVAQQESGRDEELWKLRKGERTLHCVAHYLPSGIDARLFEGEEFRRTQLCRDAPEVKRLAEEWRGALKSTVPVT